MTHSSLHAYSQGTNRAATAPPTAALSSSCAGTCVSIASRRLGRDHSGMTRTIYGSPTGILARFLHVDSIYLKAGVSTRAGQLMGIVERQDTERCLTPAVQPHQGR